MDTSPVPAENAAIELCSVFTVNVGNTHTSVAGWSDGRKLESVRAWPTDKALPDLVADWLRDGADPCATVVLAGVVPEAKSRTEAALRRIGRGVKIFRRDVPVGIEIVPDPAERVGDDRIAGVLGALSIDSKGPWIVIDAGTALTCNAAMPARDGRLPRFEGGLIAPGLALCLKALGLHTAQLPTLDAEGDNAPGDESDFSFIGRNTEEAMRWGVRVQQVAAVFAMIEGQRGMLGPDTRVAITGGGAAILREAMRLVPPPKGSYTFHPNLVHLGLLAAWRATAT